MKLATQLLSDTRSGLVVDADGRRWFRPRRVRFRTIRVEAAELLQSGWLGFETQLQTLDWQSQPNHAEIRHFAHEASRRFIEFWYRVMDVAVARAISGQDRSVFLRAFFEGSALVDIGIPDSIGHSSVPPELHQLILQEYRESRAGTSGPNTFYLSDYLEGLTDDLLELLQPYRNLWRLRDHRRKTLSVLEGRIRRYRRHWFGGEVAGIQQQQRLDAMIEHCIGQAVRQKRERSIGNAQLRDLIHQTRRDGKMPPPSEELRRLVLAHADELGLPPEVRMAYVRWQHPQRLERALRSAAMLESSAHRIDLQIARARYLHRSSGGRGPGEARIERRDLLKKQLQRRLAEIEVLAEEGRTSLPGTESFSALRQTLDACLRALGRLTVLGHHLVKLHLQYQNPSSDKKSDQSGDKREAFEVNPAASEVSWGNTNPRFPRCDVLRLPREVELGNPYQEAVVLRRVRRLLLDRLRPLRQSSGAYSLVPEHRHGALSLNPIMKLWKDRPTFPVQDEPRITAPQINTRGTLSCLLALAVAADPELAKRIVHRGRIAKLKRSEEGLSQLRLFLVPGSCYPLREVDRRDFPEFRGSVLGETRSPVELGVGPMEVAILTGGWYKKQHHCLYYGVGADNAQLLRTIWRSGRTAGPPAFFFALGQFVHDCLPDDIIYYRAGRRTFRECMEDYYLLEDRVRKNRSERLGRRRADNSRQGIRFMFAVTYARAMTESLTGSSQAQFRHPMTDDWFGEHLGMPGLAKHSRASLGALRAQARQIISGFDGQSPQLPGRR